MILPSSAWEAVVAHARASAPAECCGVLLGTREAIVEAVRTRNAAADPNRFEIDPQDHIEARRIARQRGLAVVGFYHSHPRSAARPSERDVAEATYQDCLYLIVGLATEVAEVRLYRFADAAFQEIAVAVVGDRWPVIGGR